MWLQRQAGCRRRSPDCWGSLVDLTARVVRVVEEQLRRELTFAEAVEVGALMGRLWAVDEWRADRLEVDESDSLHIPF